MKRVKKDIRRKRSIKKDLKGSKGGFKRDSIRTSILHQDDPFRRMIETERDLRAQDLPIGKLRLETLTHARRMPISDDDTLPSPTEDFIYSQASFS